MTLGGKHFCFKSNKKIMAKVKEILKLLNSTQAPEEEAYALKVCAESQLSNIITCLSQYVAEIRKKTVLTLFVTAFKNKV